MWAIVSGSYCSYTNNGACVTDGIGNHANNERCTIRANQALYATATYFVTESYFGGIIIGMTLQRHSWSCQCRDDRRPDDDLLPDGSVTNGGFIIWLDEASSPYRLAFATAVAIAAWLLAPVACHVL